jgi:response regulator RpfG family c-di-GMP phosphodiesterase
MNSRILFVDDEPNVLEAFRRTLRKSFEITTCVSPQEALQIVRTEPDFAVIVSDMRMPGMSGIELLTEVKQAKPDTVRIMLTGNHDQETAVEAVNRGDVFKFLTKPCETNTLISTLEQSTRQFQLVTAERELLTRTVQGSVKVLLDALSIAKPEAFGRNERILQKARELASGLEGVDSWELSTAALLAHLGGAAVATAPLDKVAAGRDLTKTERTEYDRHPELGAQLLSAVPRFEGIAQCVLYQHKNFDGSGFPEDERQGADIPLSARILHLALALDDLRTRGWSEAAVMQEIRSRASWYDPALLARFLEAPRSDSAKSFLVAADRLDVGLMIEEDVQNNQGVLLICRGQAVTLAIVKHLRHFHALGTLTAPILVSSSPRP